MSKLFSELHLKEDIIEALNGMGMARTTVVQEEAIPLLLANKDVIVQSQTGGGKTLAFVVPVVNKLDRSMKGIQALIIAPTRELCLQIKSVADQLIQYLETLSCECFIGGHPIEQDVPSLAASIAVATPGRLAELIRQHPKHFQRLKYLILDESDKLLGFGFESKLLEILRQLPRSRISGLFSATINEAVTRLSKSTLRNPTTLSVQIEAPAGLKMWYAKASPTSKLNILIHILNQKKKTIVFFATCAQVDLFSEILPKVLDPDIAPGVVAIHGRMDQALRTEVYSYFEREGTILICTDVAARGIDFKDIGFVVHFDVPKDYSNIVHRSGRTARSGLSGESILFVMPNEEPYIKFLKLKGMELEEWKRSEEEGNFYESFKECVKGEVLEKAVRAFVSYIRSYKEHILNYVLDYKELDCNELLDLFFLEKVPRMKELKDVAFTKFPKASKEGAKKVRRKL